MSKERDALVQLAQPEVRDGILYKCHCTELDIHDLTANELWEMYDVRWAALSESRLDKGMETFLMRDGADSQPATVQIGAIDPAGHAIGGARIHVAPLQLLGGFDAVQISRVGVSWEARGVGIGAQLVSKGLRIARAMGVYRSLPLVFLLSRVLDTTEPNRVLRLYERVGFRRTNLYTVTKGLSNCLMLAGVQEPALHHLRRQGFQVEEAREQGAIYPTLLIASSVARQIQTAQRDEEQIEETDEPMDGMVLRGRAVSVRTFTRADLPVLHHWQHGWPRPGYATISQTAAPTMAELEAAYAREVKASDRQRFAVESNDGMLIGQIRYYNLQEDIRSVSLDLLIGEPAFWNGVWGQEAVRLLLGYLFEELGVHRVDLVLSERQERMLEDLLALGFAQDGILRHNEIVDGVYVDHFLLCLLKDEFTAGQQAVWAGLSAEEKV